MSEPTSPSVGPSPPASSFMASSSPAPPSPATEYHDEADDSAQSEKKKTKKKQPKALEYPTDIPRLTKLLGMPILKEQLAMRNIPSTGKKAELIARLHNWKTYAPESVEVRPSQSDFGHIDRFSNADGERRKWVDQTENKYANAIKKAIQDNMYIIQDNMYIIQDNMYIIQDNIETTAITSNKISNCKHVIYVLTHVFRAPAELLPQKTLFTKELEKLIADAPKVLPTQSEVDNDPSFKDGKPKSKDGKSCAVCYKDFAGDSKTVCCAMCGHHIHSGCFDVYARQTSGWGTKCAVCQASWAAM
ncbi:SAM-dependent methyltransferase [Colletotrichum plurivorum]|uniref:Postreplication repair E3 ubiquitin-protein ligase RAD18 n=1 Tax=Colletotrichum plurivorum TaxID=2175906 RepID=A0A8H6U6P8_9PEZI|nr:SAM-dependent methyltransferase [Colletotrichum plurivorum]